MTFKWRNANCWVNQLEAASDPDVSISLESLKNGIARWHWSISRGVESVSEGWSDHPEFAEDEGDIDAPPVALQEALVLLARGVR